MVGEVVGGDSGAKVGAVVGATRGAAQRTAMINESTARTQYQATPAYQNAPRSNFTDAAPQVIITAQPTGPSSSGGEAIIRKDGKPVVGITYPSNWKQKVGDHYVTAVSSDGQAWSATGILEGVKDKEAALTTVKQGLEKSLQGVSYDDLAKGKSGALVLTGTGKTKKSGVNVVFAAGILDSGTGPVLGTAFVVDSNVEDHYKETVRYICQTIRYAKDFGK
jgi:hypothetical protein